MVVCSLLLFARAFLDTSCVYVVMNDYAAYLDLLLSSASARYHHMPVRPLGLINIFWLL